MTAGRLALVALFIAALSLSGCAGERLTLQADVAREVAKKLMDREAERSVPKLFDTKFDRTRSRLVDADEIQAWVRDRKIDTASLPAAVQDAIKSRRTLGLLVPNIIPKATPSDKDPRYAGDPAIFLPGFDFDMGGFWIHDMGPCNGSKLVTHCTGCSGIGCDGLAHTCICTKGCPPEKPCKRCRACSPNNP